MSKLIILRGNSGSGKSTIAKELQERMGDGTMLVQQDVIRREILKVKDVTGNPAIELIYDVVMYGRKINYSVILEGILSNKKYSHMMTKLLADFDGEVFAYYFDISFEETLRRHASKSNANEFGEEEMRLWWRDKDYLGIEGEKLITDDMSKASILKMIYEDVR